MSAIEGRCVLAFRFAECAVYAGSSFVHRLDLEREELLTDRCVNIRRCLPLDVGPFPPIESQKPLVHPCRATPVDEAVKVLLWVVLI